MTTVKILVDNKEIESIDLYDGNHKGHWISNETKGIRFPMWCRYKCSRCGRDADHTDFCPNCGADMRGE